MSANDIIQALQQLAGRVRRMRPPMSSKPEAFHEDKSEIAAELDRLADTLRKPPVAAARPQIVSTTERPAS